MDAFHLKCSAKKKGVELLFKRSAIDVHVLGN